MGIHAGLPLLCTDGDPHPSDTGYRVIADLIEEQLPTTLRGHSRVE